MRLLGWALIQHHWYPYRKRNQGTELHKKMSYIHGHKPEQVLRFRPSKESFSTDSDPLF